MTCAVYIGCDRVAAVAVANRGLNYGDGLVETAEANRRAIAAEVEGNEEVQAVVAALEQQYDAFARGAAQSLLAEENSIPTGEELADQFERYLARENKKNDG